MTIRRRLAHSNIAMFVIPVLMAAVLLIAGLGAGYLLLVHYYLPRLGITFSEFHQTSEMIEDLVKDAAVMIGLYGAVVAAVLILTIAWTNYYLTRDIFRHIEEPIGELTDGVVRIQNGNLDSPIAYAEQDEFKPVCDAVDEMAARLKKSLEEQQIQQQQKQELIAGMSHDLKNPMTSIRAYTEALLDGVAKEETVREHYLQTIHAKEMDMEAILNRLFEFARMEAGSGHARLENIALMPFLQTAVSEWKYEDMSVCLHVPEDLQVKADRVLLSRIVTNLLGNSRKYAGKDFVHVDITAVLSGSVAEIFFADDGEGVPDEQLPRLFDVFYRGDAARSRPGSGSGLGLSVVKRAVEEMGGTVRAENGAEGGLTVIFTIPVKKETDHVEDTDHRG